MISIIKLYVYIYIYIYSVYIYYNRLMAMLKGPPEYCQDGTVTLLDYNRRL